MEPRHERIARMALAAGARYGLALAGGYAVSAHGMGNRPSGGTARPGWPAGTHWGNGDPHRNPLRTADGVPR